MGRWRGRGRQGNRFPAAFDGGAEFWFQFWPIGVGKFGDGHETVQNEDRGHGPGGEQGFPEVVAFGRVRILK
jgi:hypothetical protein